MSDGLAPKVALQVLFCPPETRTRLVTELPDGGCLTVTEWAPSFRPSLETGVSRFDAAPGMSTSPQGRAFTDIEAGRLGWRAILFTNEGLDGDSSKSSDAV